MDRLNVLWDALQGALGANLAQLLGALGIFIVGWIAAALVKAGARKALGVLRINERFAGTTGQKADIEGVVALALFWVVILLTLAAMALGVLLTYAPQWGRRVAPVAAAAGLLAWALAA